LHAGTHSTIMHRDAWHVQKTSSVCIGLSVSKQVCHRFKFFNQWSSSFLGSANKYKGQYVFYLLNSSSPSGMWDLLHVCPLFSQSTPSLKLKLTEHCHFWLICFSPLCFLSVKTLQGTHYLMLYTVIHLLVIVFILQIFIVSFLPTPNPECQLLHFVQHGTWCPAHRHSRILAEWLLPLYL
jgi:hypothetical protein